MAPVLARIGAVPRASTRVYLEIGSKRVFASAADWPGWCRAGKHEQAALEALAAYAPRYEPVAGSARIPLPARASDSFDVVERLPGNATTDFGAPGAIAKAESTRLTEKETDRICALLAASWTALDRVVAKAPEALRKGPRGGGRDRDKMFEHVLGAESAYAHGLGLKLPQPDFRDAGAIRAFRAAFLAGVRAPGKEARWPAPYAVRRAAWHALDHMWEIEDRSRP
jgi:hypothetical protein